MSLTEPAENAEIETFFVAAERPATKNHLSPSGVVRWAQMEKRSLPASEYASNRAFVQRLLEGFLDRINRVDRMFRRWRKS